MTGRPQRITPDFMFNDLYRRLITLERVKPPVLVSPNPDGITYQEKIQALGAWSWWKLNETVELSDAADSIGGRDLTPFEAGSAPSGLDYDHPGPFPEEPDVTSIHFQGASGGGAGAGAGWFERDFTAVELDEIFSGTHDFTVLILSYRESTDNSVLLRLGSSGVNGLTISHNNSGELSATRLTSTITTTDVLPDEVWALVAVVYDSPTYYLNLGGVHIGSVASAGSITSSSSPFAIGNITTSPPYNGFVGRQAQCVAFDYALSEAQLADLAASFDVNPNAEEWQVLTAPGDGGPYEPRYPTIEVEY